MKKIISILLTIVMLVSANIIPITASAATSPKKTYITSLTSKTCAFGVKWKKVSSVSGYQIRYSSDKKFRSQVRKGNRVTIYETGTKNISKKKNSTTVEVHSGKYYVKIRTYKTVKGKKKYSSWSKVKTVKAKKEVTQPIIVTDGDTTAFDNYRDEYNQLNPYYVEGDYVKKHATQVIKDCRITSNMTDVQKIIIIHKWITCNVKYGCPIPDSTEEQRRKEDHPAVAVGDGDTAYEAFKYHQVKCGGYSAIFKVLCDTVGIECKMISGYAYGGRHGWNIAKINGYWYGIEPQDKVSPKYQFAWNTDYLTTRYSVMGYCNGENETATGTSSNLNSDSVKLWQKASPHGTIATKEALINELLSQEELLYWEVPQYYYD